MIALRICKSLIEKRPPEEAQTLMQLMPESWQRALKQSATPILAQEPLPGDDLSFIHPSWLAPHLRTFPESDIRLYLGALEADKAHEIRKLLGISNSLPRLKPLARRFMRKQLFSALSNGVELLPAALLPEHPCNALLQLSGTSLRDILYHWGLHDLAYEMRKIISTAELKKIFSALSKPEGEYLRSLLLKQEPIVFKRLFLHGWDGAKESLRARVEERGAQRLGCLLYSAEESLVWHLTHRLEINLAGMVLKYRQKSDHPRAEELLTAQFKGIISQRLGGESQ